MNIHEGKGLRMYVYRYLVLNQNLEEGAAVLVYRKLYNS